jgi:hypothetical protein
MTKYSKQVVYWGEGWKFSAERNPDGTFTFSYGDPYSVKVRIDPKPEHWASLALKLSQRADEDKVEAAELLDELQGYTKAEAFKPLDKAIEHFADVAEAIQCEDCRLWFTDILYGHLCEACGEARADDYCRCGAGDCGDCRNPYAPI